MSCGCGAVLASSGVWYRMVSTRSRLRAFPSCTHDAGWSGGSDASTALGAGEPAAMTMPAKQKRMCGKLDALQAARDWRRIAAFERDAMQVTDELRAARHPDSKFEGTRQPKVYLFVHKGSI